MNTDSKNSVPYQKLTWRHVGVLITCMLVMLGPHGIMFVCNSLAYTPIARTLGCQVSDLTLWVTCAYISMAVFSIPAGKLLQKYSVKILGVGASLIVCAGELAMSFYTAPWMFWITGLVQGAAVILVGHLLLTDMLGRWFHKNYGLVVGLGYSMTGVCGIVWNLIGQSILGPDLTGWPQLFQFYALVMFLCTVPFMIFFLKNHPQDVGLLPYGMPLEGDFEKELEATRIEPGFTLKEVLRMPIFWIFLIGAGLFNVMVTMVQMFSTYIQWLAHDGYGGVAIVALLMLSGTLEACCSGGQAAGKIGIGWLESKNSFIALIVGVAAGILGLLLIFLAPQLLGENSPAVIFGGGAIFGIAYACSVTMTPYICREVFGGKEYASIYAVVMVAFNLVGAFGATGWALVYQAVGWTGYFLGGMIIILIIGCLYAYTIKKGLVIRAQTWDKNPQYEVEPSKA